MGTYKLSSELPSGLVHGPVLATTLTKHTDTLEARITNTSISSTSSSSSSPALQLLHVELRSSSFRNLKLDLATSPKSPCNILSLSPSLSLSHTHTHKRHRLQYNIIKIKLVFLPVLSLIVSHSLAESETS